MSRRTQRVANVIRQIIGEAILAKLSDPRVDPARTSVTRVEIDEELTDARVYVSVMDEPAHQKLAIDALRHAKGYLQEKVGSQLRIRHTPHLTFELDEQFKKTLETYRLIDEAMAEIREKDAAEQDESAASGRGEDDQEPPQDTAR
jgi:ribosome-binding factor A